MLFWDEPEANLNPALMGDVIEVVLALQRLGVQVFMSTHNYVMLKELDLRTQSRQFATCRCSAARTTASPVKAASTYASIDQRHGRHLRQPLRPRDMARALQGVARA